MDRFKNEVLQKKIISVWGIGYLGYTTVLKLNSQGFRVNVYDITDTEIKKKLKTNSYPTKEQASSWSREGSLPKIDFRKTRISSCVKMFDSKIHILAFPTNGKEASIWLKKAFEIFLKHSRALKGALVIFESAGVPGDIDSIFVQKMKRNVPSCSFASAFRSDWSFEEFMLNDKERVIAAANPESLAKIKFFFDLTGGKYKTLSSIREAELYENARNSFQFVATTYINQIAFAYPNTNIRTMVRHLLEDVELNASHLCIGAGGYKFHSSVQNILDGSSRPDYLTIIKEARDNNLSMILSYGELIKKNNCRTVAIMGISVRGNQRSIELSPSVILAEYLSNLGIKVYVDDPLYEPAFIAKALPFCKKIDIFKNKLVPDALIVMTDHDRYKMIDEKEFKKLKISKARIVIDNAAVFNNFTFFNFTKYHLIGDGKIL